MTDTFHDRMLAEIPRLRACAINLTGSSTEADDLVQDALLRAWRFQGGFAADSNFSGWMSRILRNLFLTQRRERRSWIEDVDGEYAGRMQSAPDQEWRVRCTEVMAALPELPQDNRDALLLVAASGLSYQQAAEQQGCEIEILRGRVRRARVQLAELTSVNRKRPAPSPIAAAIS